MKQKISILAGVLLFMLAFVQFAFAYEAVRSKYSAECLLEAVAEKMYAKLDPSIPLPAVFYGSDVSLKQFQDAVEPQWGLRPEAVLNVYVFSKNEIYLHDDASYYKKFDRFIDDSLAHELAHYVQIKYKGFTAELMDDSAEWQAIEVQTWVRETYLEKGLSPCRN